MTPQRILLVASEVAPFAKSGGLADVSSALARYLGGAGLDVRIVMPLYARVRSVMIGDEPLVLEPRADMQGVEARLGDRTLSFSVFEAPLPKSEQKVLFIDCPELYGGDAIYTSGPDEPLRFAFLCRAALASCQWTRWKPDIVHCNDWHTGLLPFYMKTEFAWDRMFEGAKTVLSIHNIGYQGVFGGDVLGRLALAASWASMHPHDPRPARVNFLEAGIRHADVVTTVSETYAREIQTPELGMGLDGLLRMRSADLVGITNGVDYGEWNPATDPHIPAPYGPGDMDGKRKAKEKLVRGFDLGFEPDVPVYGVVSRLTGQKGFELFPDALGKLFEEADLRLVVLGTGEPGHEHYFQTLRDRRPHQVGFYAGYYEDLAHLIEAGSDAFLMPSRYEPCGLNQMYSLKYGTLPIVRKTGGLADTVVPFDAASETGTGFVFEAFRSDALLAAVRQSLSVWKDRPRWDAMVQRAMAQDFSWDRQGPKYVALYKRLMS